MAAITPLLLSFMLAHEDTILTRQMPTLEVNKPASVQEVRATTPSHSLDVTTMRRMGATDLADAVLSLPGVNLRDYGGAGGMKTVSVRGFGSKHTGVSYDGLMLGDAQNGEIDLSRYTLDGMERLTLTIGDAEDIFVPARQASAPAVLAVETLAPPSATDNAPHATALLRTGSFGFVNPYIRYAQNVTPCVAVAAQADYTHAYNNYPFTLHNLNLTTHEQRSNSRMDAGHVDVALRWQPTAAHCLGGKAYWWQSDRQLPGPVHYYTSLSRETLAELNAFGQLTYLGHLCHGLSLRAAAKSSWSHTDYRDPLYQGGMRDAAYWQREHYATASLLYVPTEHWSVDYAADYIFSNLNSSLATDRQPYRHTLLHTAAAKWHSKRFTITARLLHSLYINGSKLGDAADNINHLSPSVSASVRLLRNHEFYARVSYKDIFRAPTFTESYFFHYGSTDLVPEHTRQCNLGLTWQSSAPPHRGSLRFTADAYMGQVRDKIVAVPVNMFIWRTINLGRVHVAGIDIVASGLLPVGRGHQLLATANYSLQRVTNRTRKESPYYGNQLAYMPIHSGTAMAAWENPWINVSLHAIASSYRCATTEHYDGTRVDGYMELSASLYRTFRFGRHSIEARFDLRNILDTQYEIVRLYPMPGRSFMFMVKYNI